MIGPRRRLPQALLGLALLSGTTMSSQALELTASLEHLSEYSDNLGRTEDDTNSTWIHQPGFNLGASHDTATLQLDSNYTYRREIYDDDDFSDENVTTGSGSLLWTLVENRLDFTARNTRSQSTRRAQAAADPNNLQVVSNTEIGPTLRLQPRRGDQLLVDYRYLIDSRDTTNEDSQRHNGTLSYLLGLSPNRNIVLLSSYSDISYDDRDDASQLTATLGYQQTGSDFDIDVNVGYTEFDRDDADTVDGAIYNASVTWRASGSSSLTFFGNRGIQDQSSGFSNREDFDDPLPEDSNTNDVFTETRAELRWQQALGQATTLSFNAFVSDEDYEDVPQDSTRYGGGIAFSRELTRTTTLSAGFIYSNREFDLGDDEQDEYLVNFNVRHLLGRALSVNWGASYEDRDADVSRSYDETRFQIGISYQLLGTRR